MWMHSKYFNTYKCSVVLFFSYYLLLKNTMTEYSWIDFLNEIGVMHSNKFAISLVTLITC